MEFLGGGRVSRLAQVESPGRKQLLGARWVCGCPQDWTLGLGFCLLLEVTTETLMTGTSGLLGGTGVSPNVEGERGGQRGWRSLLLRPLSQDLDRRLPSQVSVCMSIFPA